MVVCVVEGESQEGLHLCGEVEGEHFRRVWNKKNRMGGTENSGIQNRRGRATTYF